MWNFDSALTWLVASTTALAAVNPAQAGGIYAYGVCMEAPQFDGVELYPTGLADMYLYHYIKMKNPKLKDFSFDPGAKVTIIKAPKLGEVTKDEGEWADRYSFYHYKSDKDNGQDRFVMQVEKDGIKVQIHYLIKLYTPDGGMLGPNACPAPWKISNFSNPLSAAPQS